MKRITLALVLGAIAVAGCTRREVGIVREQPLELTTDTPDRATHLASTEGLPSLAIVSMDAEQELERDESATASNVGTASGTAVIDLGEIDEISPPKPYDPDPAGAAKAKTAPKAAQPTAPAETEHPSDEPPRMQIRR